MVLNKGKVIKHMMSDWSRISQTNIVLCNASLRQPSKTTETIGLKRGKGAQFPRC